MKRFWKTVALAAEDVGWSVLLDGKPVRTPKRRLLILGSTDLAEAVAEEWRSVGERLDPRAMPITGLANAAIDHSSPDPEQFGRSLTGYAQTDLLFYRAEGPQELVDRQAAEWDPFLAWGRRRFDIDFRVTQGIMHVAQPGFTVERLSEAVSSLGAFALAGLAPIVTIGGSLIVGLAVLESQCTAEAAWEAVSLDERWQLEQWGADSEAEAALDNRRRDFLAAGKFLRLIED